MIKKLVDRSGVNKMFKFHLLECSAKVGSELNLDLFMVEDLPDECGVSMFWQRLEPLREIPIITIRPDRDPSADTHIKFGRVAAPLFAGIIFEKFLVKRIAYLGDDDLFRVFRLINRHTPLGKSLFHLFAGRWPANELLERVKIDREIPKATVRVRKNFVIDWLPFRKLAQVLSNPIRVGSKIVRAIRVNQDAGIVIAIKCIAGDVSPAINHE